MQKLKLFKLLLLEISFALLINGCATAPPDVPAFEALTEYITTDPATGHTILNPSPACLTNIGEFSCCHGVFIMSGKEIYVGEEKATWFNNKPCSQLLAESVYLPAQESYAPLAAYIINTCEKMKCSTSVDAFRIKLQSLGPVAIPPAPTKP